MASLKDIKLKILSYKKTGTVTHAMEAVSAVKMRKSQERALSGRSYAAAALSVLERMSGTADVERHALVQEQEGKTCFIVVTSDKGLAGSLNSAVIKRVEQEIGRLSLPKNDVAIIAMGRKGGDYFLARGYEVRLKQENVSDGVSESDVRRITDTLRGWRDAGEIGPVFIAYTNFLSTFEQEAVARRIVPITSETMHEMVAGIRPARGKYAPEVAERHENPAAYTIEPDTDVVLEALLPKLLNIAVFHGVLESKASEHSARMVAMKSATDKAKEMAQDLTRTFNRVRQAAITREVSEITSGIEAMK
ncbi:MAG: ATP synthase F1 subunit gamma [Candidatus Kaiserbacteria bacterium]|nr:MAG: ATP synthase F1 subunit gamma [Candidatus Kaiserbacteria bacterium]